MIRPILMTVLFLLSWLTLFRAPTNLLWYVSILVTEFSLLFIGGTVVLLLWKSLGNRYPNLTLLTGMASIILFAIPIVSAYRINPTIERMFATSEENKILTAPFSFRRMFTQINNTQSTYRTITYDTTRNLTLDFYKAETLGSKPCVIVVHGGSWAGGDSQQLPELNSELAKAGYPVATINYRLAPKYKYPAPVEDLNTALHYLRDHAGSLGIGNSNFVLLGRSAGGQIVVSAAYTLKDPSIKAVISFYGPIDMVWGYANPTNPLVLNSRKVMSDYLNGSYAEVPAQYINSSGTKTATISAPPTLLIHGENDPLVSHLHGVRLGKKLDSLGVKHYDVYLPWATHGFDWTLNGPGGQISTWCVMRFLEKITSHK